MSQARQIVQKSATYAIGNILRGLASFIMLPIYTRYLAPKDYGVVELISVVLDLTLLLLGARVAVGIFKFYSEASSPKEKNRVVSTALILMVCVHLLAVGVIAIFANPISSMLEAAPDFANALRIYSLSAVFAAANEVFFSYIKILDRAVTYVVVNLLKLILQLALNILLIVHLDMKYWGIIWSAVISSGVLMIAFCIWFLPSIRLGLSKFYGKQLVQFSLPIILASLAMYYITFSSRYYIQYFDSVSAVGIYALANKFGVMIFTLVAVPFSEYWSARQFDMAKEPQADLLFGNVFFYLALVLAAAGAGLLALITDFVHVSATEAYWPALPVIPWLIGAYTLQAWGDYFRFGCFYKSRNRYITYASVVTVVAITVLYVLLIPSYSALGAGISIFFGSFLRFICLYYFGQRLFHIEIPWPRILGALVYFAASAYLVSLIPASGFAGILIKGGLMSVACVGVMTTSIIEREHREALRRKLVAISTMPFRR